MVFSETRSFFTGRHWGETYSHKVKGHFSRARGEPYHFACLCCLHHVHCWVVCVVVVTIPRLVHLY